MELLNQSLELKALAEDGTFEGLAAAYGNVDAHGDRIEPGTFKSAEGEQVPLLFAHKTDQPIGYATVLETPQGLLVKGRLLLDTLAGAEAYSRLKAGVLKALSVGFQLPRDGFRVADGCACHFARCSQGSKPGSLSRQPTRGGHSRKARRANAARRASEVAIEKRTVRRRDYTTPAAAFRARRSAHAAPARNATDPTSPTSPGSTPAVCIASASAPERPGMKSRRRLVIFRALMHYEVSY